MRHVYTATAVFQLLIGVAWMLRGELSVGVPWGLLAMTSFVCGRYAAGEIPPDEARA